MKKLYEEAAVQDIADAIREKTGGAETYKIAQMGGAVRGITTGDQIAHADFREKRRARAGAESTGREDCVEHRLCDGR